MNNPYKNILLVAIELLKEQASESAGEIESVYPSQVLTEIKLHAEIEGLTNKDVGLDDFNIEY